MSEYNIQMNKYNALNAGYDQLYPATKIENVDGLDTALQNKAPAGYGLGTANVNGASYDANNCTRNGWYNCNVNTPTVVWWYILTVANYGNAVVVQKAWHYNGGKVVECMRLGWLDKAEDQGGGWQPWEWVNPPMILGHEYRTTERYQDKPVYVRLINCGTLTVTAPEVKQTELIVDNIDCVISCTATDGASVGWSFPSDMVGYVMSDKTTISCSARWGINAERRGILQIITAKTYPNNWTNNIIAMVKYTKSVN